MKRGPLTVVMYHFVRPIRGSRYPGIKGLEVAEFVGQLDYLERHYRIVDMESVVAALNGDEALPPNAALLTFDDGYVDHHAHVLPVLERRRLQGSFFVPAEPVLAGRVLDVNKLHLILATAPDAQGLAAEVEREIDLARPKFGLPATNQLRSDHRIATRFDSADIAYLKRLLQRVLPEALRASIVAALFARLVSTDERAVAEELYLSRSHIQEMLGAGMHFGGHGNRHYWLGSLTEPEQRRDIEASLAFIRSVTGGGGPTTFCYPYGDYNPQTTRILGEFRCAVSFTTRVDVAMIPGMPSLELPRLDTNDFPTTGDSPASEWTRRTGSRTGLG